MPRLFKAKVRNIGTSLGVLIPKGVVEEEGIKAGDEVELAVIKRNPEDIEKAFGMSRGASGFRREHREGKP